MTLVSNDVYAEWLTEKGVAAADLDELVHDCFAKQASGVNNQGLRGQIHFLRHELGEDAMRREFETLAEGKASS